MKHAVKPVLIGGAILAALGAGTYLLAGEDADTPAPQPTATISVEAANDAPTARSGQIAEDVTLSPLRVPVRILTNSPDSDAVADEIVLTDGILRAPCSDYGALTEDVSLEASASDMVAAIGPNGAGKTTIANCIALYHPSRGAGTITTLDLARQEYSEEPLIIAPANPYSAIRDQAPGEVSERDDAALRQLSEMMSRARLNPRDELKLGERDTQTPQIIMREPAFPCEWYTILKMGGPYASACFAPQTGLPMGAEFRAGIEQIPLAGAGGDDLIAMLRQLIELRSGSIPVAIAMHNQGRPEDLQLILLEEPTAGLLDESSLTVPEGFTAN